MSTVPSTASAAGANASRIVKPQVVNRDIESLSFSKNSISKAGSMTEPGKHCKARGQQHQRGWLGRGCAARLRFQSPLEIGLAAVGKIAQKLELRRAGARISRQSARLRRQRARTRHRSMEVEGEEILRAAIGQRRAAEERGCAGPENPR